MSSLAYLAAVNVVIWVGLFLYLWRLDRRISEREREPMKKGYWIAAGLALVFVVLGVTAFQKTLTPYLSFDEARKARGVVQVMGGLDKASDRYDTATQELSFDLVDERAAGCRSIYGGIKPGNFKDAISIVAIGPLPGRPDRGREAPRQVPLEVPGRRGREGLRLGARPRRRARQARMYFWPGVAAIWGALLAGLASSRHVFPRRTAGRTRPALASRAAPTPRSRRRIVAAARSS